MARYTEHDLARWAPEPPADPQRSAFERDRARVLHSAALRGLATKTQVITPADHAVLSNARTRLTHSLECAQIGREMGKALGRDPDLVETACLAHDLGHPPFGHNGEAALDAFAAPCGGFNANAQNLRVLTRLEAKVLTEDGRSAGLNLTRATLDAVCKYPWAAPTTPDPDVPRAAPGEPYCAYAEDLGVFRWIREGAPDRVPSFEAQIMDWADDIAYSVHDLEDALTAGLVTPAALRDPEERLAICRLTQRWHAPDADLHELAEIFARLIAEPIWPERIDEGLAGRAAIKRLTSTLIGRFCRAAQEATREAYGCRPHPAGEEPAGRYAAALVVPRATRLECSLLKGVTGYYVMSRTDHRARQARQRELLTELGDMILRGAPETLDPALRPAFEHAADDAARLRVVVDQLASLTDATAMAWHRRLSAAHGARRAVC
ncbi:deoxyguanosinetriphosphate triphosphohydrolase-like protein [Thermobispora bispora]|uniref:Deoxyguanosinetriphosphate triphosphohydrolase n=1 Tax=Thermobispora bispora (strain ATCC 19993 / DSM 43833 / CBS 139.67 / JCM 10125 / KCTC 9307 / NBRC 14880 / R51) TaxID=469371 RepID=D6Y8L0_THEBD|nr:deoxyguanosinetriphosphate triphosphohydrolase [Thermobispora bispora]ADG87907.1 deoxyguanosinetriphosphate triphosphohydrolase [Thermobispora bispora DSM 43833]MBO2473791.1 deoxyguanosinetriphosphate triphosphohydrolase [Actinomycetales bacterium]MDI9579451.1 deoxyguanosinetriphosphate triphosphohydrolase [Thermobispora sp.]QSI47787.1 deoxyguanosinetriphosphate triphosphohydrolase [Thermobispora bispora]